MTKIHAFTAGFAALLLGLPALPASAAVASPQQHAQTARYEVTITNLTVGQQFTPFLLTTHNTSVSLFDLGTPASSQLRALAEEGNTTPLADLLHATPGVRKVVVGSGLTNPGQTVSFDIDAGYFDRISLAAMLIPTNDSFVAVDGAELPFLGFRHEVTLYAPAYDAGTESNDELCASIPGPFFAECGGPGGGAQVGGGAGFVHISSGVHGVGDLAPALRDWRNPVAKIVIKRVR
jgi:hypothetical protein